MPSFSFMKRSREVVPDRQLRRSKRQKLNNARSKDMPHRFQSHPIPSSSGGNHLYDSKSSQLSPISPRIIRKSRNTIHGHCPSAPLFKYERHPSGDPNKRVISLISDTDNTDNSGNSETDKEMTERVDPEDSISSYSSAESANSDLYEQDAKGYLVFVKGLLILNKYKVIRQLGKGTFSRVFECYQVDRRRKRRSRHKQKKFAVKVIRNVYKYQVAAQTELEVLKKIRRHDKDGSSCCIHLVEDSIYKGHPVLVFPLLGKSVYSFMVQSGYKPFQTQHVVDLLWQICTGVEAIHSLKIIMTDLKPENIVLVNDAVDQSASHRYSSPQSTDIRLIDFGSAVVHKHGAKHRHLIQTRHYRAPEAIFSMDWSFEADIWSIGCILVEFVFGKMLFNTHCSIDHLNQIVKCIGSPPSRLLEKVSDSVWNSLFDAKGNLNMEKATVSPTQCKQLGRYFDRRHYDEQSAQLYDLCTKMLRWDAKDRISAKEALQHPVFADYQ